MTLTSASWMPPYFASAAVIFACCAGARFFACTRTESLPTIRTLASPRPSGSIALRTSVIDALPVALLTVNCHWVPPSKSMPRFSPLIAKATTEIRMSVPDSSAHRHDRSMNWKCVRSW